MYPIPSMGLVYSPIFWSIFMANVGIYIYRYTSPVHPMGMASDCMKPIPYYSMPVGIKPGRSALHGS